MTSLRGRLLIGLLLLVFAVDGLAGYFGYRRALQSTSILLDYQLHQMALSFRDQLGRSLAPQLSGETTSQEFAIQITGSDGSTIYTSRPQLPIDTVTSGYTDLMIQNQRWRVYSLVVEQRVIRVAQPWRVREELAGSAALRSLAPLLILTPVLALAIWLMVLSTLAPIGRLVKEVRLRDAESLSPLQVAALPGELAPVVTEMNRLLERLRTAFHAQRGFISDAAHELRSPLTALRIQLQLLRRAGNPAEQEQAMRELERVMERAAILVQQMLTLARYEPGVEAPPLAPVRLDSIVRDVVTDCASFAVSRRIDLELDSPAEISVTGDADSLRVLVRNLVDNAIRYTPADGCVVVRTRQDQHVATLAVDDSGPGIAEAHRARIFDRFYRGDATAEPGSGLGLAIVKAIADRHQAGIRLATSSLGGLEISLDFAKLQTDQTVA
jgi:two-component system OmpR family sensor kinase/two-component system sensor histidine kinase QseC